VLVERNGKVPHAHASARIASSATVVGNVEIGARAYVDHGVVIASSGPRVEIADEAIVLAGAIVRSVGGASRPAFPVRVGERTLVSPLCVLTGCEGQQLLCRDRRDRAAGRDDRRPCAGRRRSDRARDGRSA
jgi:carbonic anhydrase/acetyltransferase-like protein (isoleucine patch superfamily)